MCPASLATPRRICHTRAITLPTSKQVPIMRTLLRLASCAAILPAFTTPARSQGIFDRIKKKATDAVSQKGEDKVNSKIDEMSSKLVDKSFATMFGDSAGAKGGPGAAGSPF